MQTFKQAIEAKGINEAKAIAAQSAYRKRQLKLDRPKAFTYNQAKRMFSIYDQQQRLGLAKALELAALANDTKAYVKAWTQLNGLKP